jgi:hypothetical protein
MISKNFKQAFEMFRTMKSKEAETRSMVQKALGISADGAHSGSLLF